MNVLVTNSAHFVITSDGTLWTADAATRYSIWTRYLDVFNEVHLLVRVKFCGEPPKAWVKASGYGVKPIPIPDFVGPSWEYVKNYVSIKRAISKAIANAEAIQLHVPCIIAGEAWNSMPSRRPYFVEVIADPYDDYAPGSIKHPLQPLFRWWFTRQLQRQCQQASAALYVTKQALQRRYPCPKYSVGVSDVELLEGTLVSKPRPIQQEKRTFKLIIVGSLAQLYKAPDVLIEAVSICVKEGLDLKLIFVGDGRYRAELEAKSVALGLGDRVLFRGQLPTSEAVREQLDQCDLFLLPSRMEGLPRAMVEAMARSLPCIGSTVGGIPELLPAEDMVTAGDAVALAHKIREVVTNPERMALMSARNLNKAKEYKREVLKEQQVAFYRYARENTQEWLKAAKLF
ncbi:glycosyltransferase family 4 protein [Nostoc sp. MG11]|uniref:glycosyltransferase family 4 protein n=1 Tax=Nostoc sp. MG11 TaxID=2721166 RepID=UPI001868F5B7|nr:glycosyltransferase family 4 protein [Nostoc sp. MG11]